MRAIDVLKYLLAKAESEVPEGHQIVGLNVPVDIVREIIDAQPDLQPTCNQLATDCISRQAAIDCLCNGKCTEEGRWCDDGDCMPVRRINSLPPAEPEPYLDSIVSEIEKTISETRESGKHHDINVRTNGEMICFGLQLALEIIEEKRNERFDK